MTVLSAEMFARVVRGHWGIENRLHWVLDMVFREDLTRLRSGNAPENRAQPVVHGKAHHKLQEPPQEGWSGCQLPRNRPAPHRVRFKRFARAGWSRLVGSRISGGQVGKGGAALERNC
jgi:hypothetical protein